MATLEIAVLSSLLQSPQLWPAVESYSISPADFEDPECSRIFGAMASLFSAHKHVDPVTIAAQDPGISIAMLSEAEMFLADASRIDDYCQYLVDLATKKRAKAMLATLDNIPSRDVVPTIKRFLEDNQRYRREAPVAWDEAVEDAVDDILTRRLANMGVSTGISGLDKIIVGLRPGGIYIIAGRPGMGKTTLALNMARSAAGSGSPAGIVSLEMARHELIVKLLSQESGIGGYGLQTGMIPKDKHDDLRQAEQTIKHIPLHVIDDCPATFTGVSAATHSLVHKYGCRVVFIDYLQLMRSKYRAGNREQEVADISRRMKETARELNIPIVPLSQLSRQPEARVDKRPVLSDLRESGALEQDADVVMMLYRPGYYEPAEYSGTEAEVHIVKNRHGESGIVPLTWDGSHSRFATPEHWIASK